MAKKKNKGKQFEEPAGIVHNPKHKRPHLAEEFLEKGDGITARNLCEGMTRAARYRVIGGTS